MSSIESVSLGLQASHPSARLDANSLLHGIDTTESRQRLSSSSLSLLLSMRATGSHLPFLISISPQKTGAMATMDNTLQELLSNIKEFLEEARVGYWPVQNQRAKQLARLQEAIKALLHRLYKAIKDKGRLPWLHHHKGKKFLRKRKRRQTTRDDELEND